MLVKDYCVELIKFDEEDIQQIRQQISSLRLNPNGANGLLRTSDIQEKNKLMGFLAEKAVYDTFRKELGSLVYKKETNLSNQIDLFVGTKTIEVRSSQVKGGIETALFAKRNNGDSVYHLVGCYTTSYKKQEILKDYYIWVVFEDTFDHCYIVGGATKDMIQSAPEITMIPKGKVCNNPTKYKGLKPDQILQYNQVLEFLTPSKNERLSLAKQNKEDEFYTLFSTVEKEIVHYKDCLKNKIVYLPCDNPKYSNFWKYFVDHFEEYHLLELRATYLNGHYTVYNGTTIYDYSLADNGSYDTEECLNILKDSDIVITNPPFSVFRYFILKLLEYKKDFIILGNQNAATTKEIFPYFQNDTIRYGYFMGSEKFKIPSDYETRSNNVKVLKNGDRLLTVEGIRWFTTLPLDRKYQLVLKKFNPFVYKQYDNYPAYEVPFVKDIPDFSGLLGVPISYLNVHNPDSYELIGTSDNLAGPVMIDGKLKQNPGRFYINGKRLYQRIVIRRKTDSL